MWHCSRCGEEIPDNFDVCWHCGTNRDGAAPQDFQAEPDDPSVPDPKPELPKPDQATGDERAPGRRSERVLTRESLAVLLLRLMGVYFAAFGIVGVVAEASNLLLLSRRLSLDDALVHYHLEYLARPGAELLIGIYFMVGGQWVYDKILTPIVRSSPEDAPAGTEEDGSDAHQAKHDTRSPNTDRPQSPPAGDQPGG